MSKNTNISELINYLSYDGSGNIVFNTVSSATTNTDKFLVSDTGVLKFRTAAQLLSDIGAQASGSYQSALSGTGFVKISGTTISYDNSTYATETYVGTAVSNLVGAAPSTLDTLNELATALGNDANFATTIATSIGTKQPQLNGTGFVKISGTTISYDSSTYLTTGTASSTYVPYTGATVNVNLGVYNLAGGNVNINGGGSGGGALRLKQFGSSEANLEGYNSISTLTSGVFYFTSSASVPNFKNFVLNPSGLTDNTLRTYTLPDASGTLALTSNIPSVSGVYLPLAGGTLTGALSGTSATFSSTIDASSTITISGVSSGVTTLNLFCNGAATNRAKLQIDASGSLYIKTNENTTVLELTYQQVAKFASSVQATDFRYTNTGYLTYDTANTGTESLVIRKFGTSVLTFGSTGDASFNSNVSIGSQLSFNSSSLNIYTYGRVGLANAGRIIFNNGTGANLWFGETSSNVYGFTPNAYNSTSVLSMNMSSNGVTVSGNITNQGAIFTQAGVTRHCFSGSVAGSGTLTFTINSQSQSVFRITCMMNHYGYVTSYGCANESFVGMGPVITVTTISDVQSANGGSWSYARINDQQFTVTKNAGTYGGGGNYFVEIVGNNSY